MDSPKKVTVFMTVYNGEKYLKEAIESILNQTFRDFEFIIINNGSTDGTSGILATYQQKDARIHVYRQKNQGITASRNRGCRLAQGDYIAVMDADDVSLPERLAKQVEFLDAHHEIGVLGTWIQWIDENGKPSKKLRPPTAPGTIGWVIFFENCLAHSSVMMRRNVVERLGFYNPDINLNLVEDYDLWGRASEITRLANIPEFLLEYRWWEGNVTSQHRQIQEQNAAKIMHSMITRLLGKKVSLEIIASLRQVTTGNYVGNIAQIEPVVRLIQQLYHAYLQTKSLNRAECHEVTRDVSKRLYNLALFARKISFSKFFIIFFQSLRLDPPYVLYMSIRLLARVVRTRYRKA